MTSQQQADSVKSCILEFKRFEVWMFSVIEHVYAKKLSSFILGFAVLQFCHQYVMRQNEWDPCSS